MSSNVSDQMSDHDSCSTCSCRTTQAPTQPSISSQLDRLQAEMELLKLGQQSLQYSVSSSLYILSSLSKKSLPATERDPASLPQTGVDQDRSSFILEKIVSLESNLNALSRTLIDFRERAGLETRQANEQQKTTLESATNIQSVVSDPAVDSNISSNSSKAQVQVKSPQENLEQEHPASTLVTESCQKSMDSLPLSTLENDPTAEVASSVQENEDVTSPHREFLRARIEGIRKVMVEIEQHGYFSYKKKLSGDISTIDDDVYLAWCASEHTFQFKRNLFQLIGRLQDEEEQERKRLRDMDTRIYGVLDVSPHVKYLRAKIEAARLSSCDVLSKDLPNGLRPQLSTQPLLMDLDVFKTWCFCSKDYNRSLDFRDYDYSDSYQSNIGLLISSLMAREKEERKYLLQRKKNRN
ncbi:hypothetical protein BGZ58_001727 [Dissophora ornata]|nr:hypothetical protein BGZ58_001727 [Dissophora ornata]